jgi:excisionase family DNA binding protein
MEGRNRNSSDNDRLLIGVSEAAQMLSVSKSKLYELINQGMVPAIKVGHSLRIPVEQLRKWIAEQLEAFD